MTASCSSWRQGPVRPNRVQIIGAFGRRAARSASCFSQIVTSGRPDHGGRFPSFWRGDGEANTNGKTIERQDGSKEERHSALDKKRRIDTAFEIYLGLYQAITRPEERQKLYREFSSGFFDLIVIDECHRGSAAEDSAWREILNIFPSATQIGLTATPKETGYVSNIDYSASPSIRTRSKQGIQRWLPLLLIR